MNGYAEEVLADPVGVVVRLVGNVERHLDADRVREIVCMVMRERAGRRRQVIHELATGNSHLHTTAPTNVAVLNRHQSQHHSVSGRRTASGTGEK